MVSDIFWVLILPTTAINLPLTTTLICYSIVLYLLLLPGLYLLSRSRGHLDFAPLYYVLSLILLLPHALFLSLRQNQKIGLILLLDGVPPHRRYLVDSSQYLHTLLELLSLLLLEDVLVQ